MIGKISGLISLIYQDSILINVGNQNSTIDYEISVCSSLLQKYKNNDQISLFIKYIQKEDSVVMYGFEFLEEKLWFEELIKVDGLGPRTALSIMSSFSINEIKNAILLHEDNLFIKISGIGKKIASRIVVDMQKAPQRIDTLLQNIKIANTGIMKLNIDNEIYDYSLHGKEKIIDNIVNALVGLGFAKNTVSQKIKTIVDNLVSNNITDLSEEHIIKIFLQEN